jgi:hypothetical protein
VITNERKVRRRGEERGGGEGEGKGMEKDWK